MANEVYRAVLDKLSDPLTIKRLNEENKRLRILLKAAREERNALYKAQERKNKRIATKKAKKEEKKK